MSTLTLTLPHVLAVPYPAQGHVIPMMELANKLVHHGIKVTVVNPDFIHNQVVMSASSSKNNDDDFGNRLQLVSVANVLEHWEDVYDIKKLTSAMQRVMPAKLEELIQNMKRNHSTITCLVTDGGMKWSLELAKKMGIKSVVFSPASATMLAVALSIPKLIEDGIIDGNDGTILKKQLVHLSPTMPAINTETFAWNCFHDQSTREGCFEVYFKNKSLKVPDIIICNSAYELESAAFSSFPYMLPVGPLSATNKLGNHKGNFWPQDSACLSWLDLQPPCSVIYVAFGSFTKFIIKQFQELALGLELTNMPFLWVVRPGLTSKETIEVYPQGFEERIGDRGRIVGWAPQVKVLRHPSVACFVSHCGWNSTTEGLSNGVPFLCWPYFADQFFDKSYICDVLKVGLGFEKDEGGIVTQGEIKNKVEQLLGDRSYKERAMDLKEKIVNSVQEGSSYKNLSKIIEWIRDTKP